MLSTWKAAAVGILVCAAGTACVPTPNVIITPLGAERTYSPTPDSVAIKLYATAKPECPYDEIAAITAEASEDDATMIAILRSKARSVGAEAIVGYMQSMGRQGANIRSGTAIRFRSASCKT